ncbi:hypothetical protein GN958_ATG22496 [Phytophthora infestans]|uniref:Uncharacterized protein n=1 Tax=Phytophthora infestans TaxID=4787 RepID=A0A8S9TJZ5_PHYIN|nr:hypothetical protein GN958_ATG22496 [Phytophthora infestans]
MLKHPSNTATVMTIHSIFHGFFHRVDHSIVHRNFKQKLPLLRHKTAVQHFATAHDFVRLLHRPFGNFRPIIIDELSKFCVKPVSVYIGYADNAVGIIATYCAVIIVECFVIQ